MTPLGSCPRRHPDTHAAKEEARQFPSGSDNLTGENVPPVANKRPRGCSCGVDVCDHEELHEQAIEAVRKTMPPPAQLQDLAALFKALGDHTRVRLLAALAAGELCVCDLTAVLELSQSAVSHQLRLLRAAKLVRSRREGKNVFYSLDDAHVLALFDQGLEHVRHK